MQYAFDLPLFLNSKHVTDLEMVATIVPYEDNWACVGLAVHYLENKVWKQTDLRQPHAMDKTMEALIYRQAIDYVEFGCASEVTEKFYEQYPHLRERSDKAEHGHLQSELV